MRGKIIKGIAGFYYVHTQEEGVLSCKARGIFRKDNKKPLVGDDVIVEMTDEIDREGSIKEILKRKNELLRPACSNIDQALITFACKSPDPNPVIIDKMILSMMLRDINFAVCFNKTDLLDDDDIEKLIRAYEDSGNKVILISAQKEEGMDELNSFLDGKTTVILGPSGAGKSSITNFFSDNEVMEVGEISRKLMRGKNTTRHAELFPVGKDTYIMDTPGFTALDIREIKSEDLRSYYDEFSPYEGKCRFNGCVHINEPACEVKNAVASQEISELRYNNYKILYEEIIEEEKRRYK